MRLEHSHSPEAIRHRLAHGPKVSYLKDVIYGGIDGTITTFAIVAGAIGADLPTRIVIILGIANIVADGLSMAAANYSGTKAEVEDYRRLRAMEERHIRADPSGERAEVREIYRNKGYRGSDLDDIVGLLTQRREVWIDTMLAEEFGRSSVIASPLKAALATFAAFVACGAVPLLPFLVGMPAAATSATLLTALTFFAIGSAKSRWSTRHFFWSGLETAAVGLAAAGAAFAIGHVLEQVL
ncbi:VIT1/CCC1 transporter family protein [Acuticoccus sp.]|uniref:VIT1/CCC1 transporter family protein n=1 Tax=Acuticoccus sp. TaxID=1904378 RepID=UPI003B52199C